MRYLWPQAGDVSHLPPQYGIMTRLSDKTIAQGIRAGRSFAVDNEAFTRGFKPSASFRSSNACDPTAKTVYDWCADHLAATDDLTYYLAWEQWQRTSLAFDVLFMGGSTAWKLGQHAMDCIHWAKRLGVPVHSGRVNSQTRFRHFQLVGADFCAGTTAAYAPTRAAKRLNKVVLQPALLQI